MPRSNVCAIQRDWPCEGLAAVPESHATAWTALMSILGVAARQVILIRGATSALGQAAVNLAVHAGAHVIASTRKADRVSLLRQLGAQEVLLESPELSKHVRETHSEGIDAVLDIVGNTTVLDSLASLRRGGAVVVLPCRRSTRRTGSVWVSQRKRHCHLQWLGQRSVKSYPASVRTNERMSDD